MHFDKHIDQQKLIFFCRFNERNPFSDELLSFNSQSQNCNQVIEISDLDYFLRYFLHF